MKKLLPFSFILFISLSVSAQTTQIGRTVAYNGKAEKSALSGVNIIAGGATDTSNTNGDFSLEMKTVSIGDRISTVSVRKTGYVLFNKDAVDTWTASDNTFEIVMCDANLFAKMVDRYYNLGIESYNRKLSNRKKEIKALLRKNQVTKDEYEMRISELEEQYRQNTAQLLTVAEHFARIDESKIDSVQTQAIELIKNYKIDEAIDLLESQEYITKLKNEVKKRKNAESRLKQGKDIMCEGKRDSLMVERQIQFRDSLKLILKSEKNGGK